MGLVPTGSVEVAIVTVPAADTVPLPTGLPALVIVIVPVAPAGTEAVIVTELPHVLGPEVVTLTVGVALLIVSTSVAVALLLLESPL